MCRIVSYPLTSVSLFSINQEKRTITIVCTINQEISFNWGYSHTIQSNGFRLIVPLIQETRPGSATCYNVDGTFHIANGIYNATLRSKKHDFDDDFLF